MPNYAPDPTPRLTREQAEAERARGFAFCGSCGKTTSLQRVKSDGGYDTATGEQRSPDEYYAVCSSISAKFDIHVPGMAGSGGHHTDELVAYAAD